MKLNIGYQQRKINKTKSQLFEKINKIIKPQARLTKKKDNKQLLLIITKVKEETSLHGH